MIWLYPKPLWRDSLSPEYHVCIASKISPSSSIHAPSKLLTPKSDSIGHARTHLKYIGRCRALCSIASSRFSGHSPGSWLWLRAAGVHEVLRAALRQKGCGRKEAQAEPPVAFVFCLASGAPSIVDKVGGGRSRVGGRPLKYLKGTDSFEWVQQWCG